MVSKFKVLLLHSYSKGFLRVFLGSFCPTAWTLILTMYQSWYLVLYTITATLVGKRLKYLHSGW